MSDASVKVICRFRPVNERERSEGEREDAPKLTFPDDQTVVLNIPNQKPQIFQFDRVFWDTSTRQIDIYEYSAKETIDDIFAGYNGTIFAYGQTGAGKSFTMFGPDTNSNLNAQREELKGIIPRACEHIFDKISNDEAGTEFFLKCSFLEIYKENIRDLLEPSRVNLKVRETPSQGVWVQDLSEHFISCIEDIYALLQLGEKSRAVSSTKMNLVSSRSHSLFILTLTQKNADGSTKEGKLNLADLAGSEKVGKTGATGETLEEAKKINQSLSALGNCINALTKSKKGHIPYRDSKLTHILRESLGGNSKTTLIIACSPHSFNIDETISTLKFGQRAKSIKNKVKINQQRSVKELESIIENMTKDLTNSKRYIDLLEETVIGFDQTFDFTTLKKRVGSSRNKSDENDSDSGSAPTTPRKGIDEDIYNPMSIAEFNVKIEQLKEKHYLETQDLLEEIKTLKMNKSQIDEEMYESIQNELEICKEELEELKMKLKLNDSIIKEKSDLIDELNEDKQSLIQRIESIKKENNDLFEQITLEREQKMNLQNQLSVYLETLQKTEFTLKQSNESIELLKIDKETMEKRCNDAEEKLIKIEEEAKELRKELSNLKSNYIDIEAQLQSKTNEIEKLSSKQSEEMDVNNLIKEELEEEKKKNIELLSNFKRNINKNQELEEEISKERSKCEQILEKFQNLQNALEQNEIRFSEREKRWNDRISELESTLKKERTEKEQLRNEVKSLIKKLTERDSVIKSTEEALILVKRENEISTKKLINQFGEKIKSLTDQIESLTSERDAAVVAYNHVQEKLIQVQLNENINQPIINIPKKSNKRNSKKIAVPIKGGTRNNNNNKNVNNVSPQSGVKKRVKYSKNDLPTYGEILDPIKTGVLWIQSSVLKKWDEIFCFLEGYKIYYFGSKESERADGLFDIEDCVSMAVTLNETYKDRYPFVIEYNDNEKPVLLFAESEEERRSWVEVINETSQKKKNKMYK